jgi:cell division transport system permease protein
VSNRLPQVEIEASRSPVPRRFSFLPDGKGSGGVLPWVIAVMVYLSALAIAGGLSLRGAAGSWTADLSRTVTILVPTSDPDLRAKQVAQISQTLSALPGVERADAISAAEQARLLEPWLGEGNVSQDLPIPAMIDVVLAGEDAPATADLEALVSRFAPDGRVDDHQQWLGQIFALTRTIEIIALAIVALVALATMAIVAFGTRAGLSTHRATIEVLHMMGAGDSLIAAVLGGVIGLIAAMLTLAALGWFIAQLGQGLIGSTILFSLSSVWVWLTLLALPLLAGVLTMLTARWTVKRALEEFL